MGSYKWTYWISGSVLALDDEYRGELCTVHTLKFCIRHKAYPKNFSTRQNVQKKGLNILSSLNMFYVKFKEVEDGC